MLKNIPESKMGKADSLSRRPDWEIGVERDNEDETLVKPKWLKVRRMEIVEIIVDRVDLLEEVRKSKVKDDKVSYDRKYPFNNIISFLFYIITNFSLLNFCCLLL